MTLENLEKAKEIWKEIDQCKENIKLLTYTQSENVAIRETFLKVNGIEDITIPKSLFRLVGRITLLEYSNRLKELETELQNI